MLEKAYLAPRLGLVDEQPPVEGGGPDAADQTPDAAGRAFADAWVARATDEEVRELAGRAPRIPRELDAELFKSVETSTGSLGDDQPGKHAVRASFWDVVEDAAREPTA